MHRQVVCSMCSGLNVNNRIDEMQWKTNLLLPKHLNLRVSVVCFGPVAGLDDIFERAHHKSYRSIFYLIQILLMMRISCSQCDEALCVMVININISLERFCTIIVLRKLYVNWKLVNFGSNRTTSYVLL